MLSLPALSVVEGSKHLCRTATVASRAEEFQSLRVTGEPAEKLLSETRAKYS